MSDLVFSNPRLVHAVQGTLVSYMYVTLIREARKHQASSSSREMADRIVPLNDTAENTSPTRIGHSMALSTDTDNTTDTDNPRSCQKWALSDPQKCWGPIFAPRKPENGPWCSCCFYERAAMVENTVHK